MKTVASQKKSCNVWSKLQGTKVTDVNCCRLSEQSVQDKVEQLEKRKLAAVASGEGLVSRVIFFAKCLSRIVPDRMKEDTACFKSSQIEPQSKERQFEPV